jgi:CDP-diacylglycerol---glycerol-3-phosphate 3-phosphatidyltransferase
MRVIEVLRQIVISGIRPVARGLNKITRGRLSPDTVTIVGVVLHVPVAVLIASGSYWALAGLLLVVVGLFDKLDGELARLQDHVTDHGGFLDASTDRIKEVLLYTAAAYWLALSDQPAAAALAAAACGVSLLVSYIKAKGEAVIASSGKKLPYPVLNKLFADGLMMFEIRMFVLVVGLISGYLAWSLALIVVLASFTAIKRLVNVSRALRA